MGLKSKLRLKSVDTNWWIFWAILMVILIALPNFKGTWSKLPGGSESIIRPTEPDLIRYDDISTKEALKMAVTLEINNNSGAAPLAKPVCFEVPDGGVRVVATSPSQQPRDCELKGDYAYAVFDAEGKWDIDVLDKNGSILKWFQVHTY
jgi:hypothetical protein